MIELPSSKKAWLDFLYYDVGKQRYDFYVSGLYKKKDDEIISTKWLTYSQACFHLDKDDDWLIGWINQRQILPIEVVLDLEDRQRTKVILQELDHRGIRYFTYDTGSRGVHIHLFFDRELSVKEKSKIIAHYGADSQKASQKTQIALEFTPHWKSGRNKELIAWK